MVPETIKSAPLFGLAGLDEQPLAGLILIERLPRSVGRPHRFLLVMDSRLASVRESIPRISCHQAAWAKCTPPSFTGTARSTLRWSIFRRAFRDHLKLLSSALFFLSVTLLRA